MPADQLNPVGRITTTKPHSAAMLADVKRLRQQAIFIQNALTFLMREHCLTCLFWDYT